MIVGIASPRGYAPALRALSVSGCKEVSMRSRILMMLALVLVSVGLAFAGGQAQATAPGEPVPVMIWLPGGAQDDQAAVNQAARDYAGPLIGAYPEVQFFGWGEWWDRKQLAIQSREEMDIVFTAEWNNYHQEVLRNAWLPLNDLIDDHAPALRDAVGFFLEGPVRDGRIYAIPTVKEGADSAQWFFNEQLVQKYSIPYRTIVTPADLEPYLQLIKDNEPDVIPYLLDGVSELTNATLHNVWNRIGAGADFTYFEDTGRVQYKWHRDETWERARRMRDWYLRGFFQPEVDDVGGETNSNRYFQSGNWFAYSHVGHPGKAGELSAAHGYTIVGTGPLSQPVVTTDILLGSMMAISQTSRKPVESIKLLELMNTDQRFNNLLNYGVEGRHFRFVNEQQGIIEAIPNSGYAPNMQWALQNQFLTYLYPTEDPRKWENYLAFNDSAKLSPVVGFTADQGPIRTQLASISNVKELYDQVLQRGLEDPGALRADYLAALRDAGVEQVEAELTRQVREFLAGR